MLIAWYSFEKISMPDLYKRTKELCRQYGIRPSRRKGQNFLIKEDIFDKIIEAAEVGPDEAALEVGPGLGFLTERLAKKARQAAAVEIDAKLYKVLDRLIKKENIKNIKLINKDILGIVSDVKKPLAEIFTQDSRSLNYKVVANLPYNITSVFLRKILERPDKPRNLVLMLQKEVAERITAKPGQMSLLAVSVQFYSHAEILFKLAKENFWPTPKVDSAVIKIAPHENYYKNIDEKQFFRLTRIGFSGKRKMLKNNLASGYHLGIKIAEKKIINAGFDPKIRAQELGIADWAKLLKHFK